MSNAKLDKVTLRFLSVGIICLCLCGVNFFYSYIDPYIKNLIYVYIKNYYLSLAIEFAFGFFLGFPYIMFCCFGIEIMCDQWVEKGKLLYLALVSYGGVMLCAWYFDVYKFISGLYNFFIFFGDKENLGALKGLLKCNN